jgi:hypothetical protein
MFSSQWRLFRYWRIFGLRNSRHHSQLITDA